ncbi:MAG TPA: acetylxylan esterase [Verrucomicrobiae bacterium]|nr:acetylxylan esterase [Verrucomicrobiae bacterium]
MLFRPQRLFHRFLWAISAATLLGFLLTSGCQSLPGTRPSSPWNISELRKPPTVLWGNTNGLVQELYYVGEPLLGKPTRVFAYLARPTNSLDGKLPAMVLVHGGGGKAFTDWAQHWAQRGYVALAMDLAGNGPTSRLPDGGPDQADAVKFRDFHESGVRDMWTYHAVAAVVRGHSLLRSLPEVDRNRTGITGISWGGYLTCIAAGIDSRFEVAVPVYGCGFLGENSVWKDKPLGVMSPPTRELWLRLFDPSRYVGAVRCPVLFVNGTTDFAYPLDSYRKTYRLVPEKYRHVSVAVDRPHGHIWTFPEVDVFVASVLRNEPSLARFGAPVMDGSYLAAPFVPAGEVKDAQLCFTTDVGPWQKRKWQCLPAQTEGGRMRAMLPITRPLVAFLAARDAAGCHVSSEHIELPETAGDKTRRSPGAKVGE